MDYTVLPANNTISAFIRKHSPGDANAHIRIANTDTTPEFNILAGHPSTAHHGAGHRKFTSHRLMKKSER